MTTTPLSRRDWLLRSACGFGHLAMLGLAAQDAGAATPDPGPVRSPLAPRPPHFPARAKTGGLPVHARRDLPCRHVRPQAEAEGDERPAAADRQAEVRVRADGQPAVVAVEVSTLWAERDRGERPVPADRFVHRRHLRHPVDVRRRSGVARTRAPEHQHRQRSLRPSLPGGVDALRPGDREPEPAGLPQPESVALSRRGPELRLGVPPRDLSGDAHRGREHEFQGGQAVGPLAGRRSPAAAAAARPARATESPAPGAGGRGPGTGSPDRLVRDGLPDAGRGAGRDGHRPRVGGDPGTLRRRRGADGRIRPAVPAGATMPRGRSPVRPGQLQLPQELLGRPRRPPQQPFEQCPEGRPADRRAC